LPQGRLDYWCPGYDWGTVEVPAGTSTSATLTTAEVAGQLSPYNYGYRNCTDYVAWKLASLGVKPAQYGGREYSPLGDGKTWGTNAAAHGVANNATPAVGSVAVDPSGEFGHVAFVTAWNGTDITVSQYNYNEDGNYTTQTGTPASLGFTSFDHFEKYETTTPPSQPAPVIATAVAAHDGGYCAVLKSQDVECWGTNQYGLLGDGGSEPASYIPVYVKGLGGVNSLAGNGGGVSENVCALLVTGRVECWGDNGAGELGNGGNEDYSNTPVLVRTVADAKSAFALNSISCAILVTGRVYCWGGGGGSGGVGNGANESSHVPVAVRGITDATSLSGGLYSTCALLTTGGVDCWGENQYGQLGNGGNEAYSYVPVAVSGMTDAKRLFGAGYPYCAVLATGGLDCWGNGVGTTGDGTGGVESDVPVAISGITDAKSIAFADNGSTKCALLTTGGVDCWGSNSDGLLGNGANAAVSAAAVRVGGLTNVVSIASGNGTFCVLHTTGGVSCWGDGALGELGNGSTTTSSLVPVATKGLSDAVGITGGDDGFCTLLRTGGVDCWGLNFTQRPRGPGNAQYSIVPVPVAGLGS